MTAINRLKAFAAADPAGWAERANAARTARINAAVDAAVASLSCPDVVARVSAGEVPPVDAAEVADAQAEVRKILDRLGQVAA